MRSYIINMRGDQRRLANARHREHSVNDVARRDRAKLFLPRVIGLQTVLQVVGRCTAERLLAARETPDRPVHTIIPGGARELTQELGGSTIQKKSRTGNGLAREIKRSWYRAQVKLRPQRA